MAAVRDAAGVVVQKKLEVTDAVFAQVQVESDSFWTAIFNAQEAELLKLQQLVAAPVAPEVKETAAAAPVAAAAETAPAVAAAETDLSKKFPGMPELNFKPMNKNAQLIPMMTMLQGLYEDGKDRIGTLNSKEEKSKQWFTEKEQEHTVKLKDIEDKFESHHLSEKFRDDEMADTKRMWSYWSRVRSRQHRQYLSALKIQHGTMKRIKTMLGLYEDTLNGKGDAAKIQEELSKVMSSVTGGAGGHLVLIQEGKSMECCQREIEELHRERAQFDDVRK